MSASNQNDRIFQLSDMVEEPERMLRPIQGYENMPLVTLEEAVKPLILIIPQVQDMVRTVKPNCTTPADGLSSDESASIMLYTLEVASTENSFYAKLNSVLRSEQRRSLGRWFLYLKLFITALSKLPSQSRTVYRGVTRNLSGNYYKGKTVVYWEFTSCTSTIHVLGHEEFLGQTGPRTLFTIDCYSGKDIRKHSIHSHEDEILLLAARQFEVIGMANLGDGLHRIHLKETEPSSPLLAPLPLDNTSILTMIPQKDVNYRNDELEQLISQCQSRKLNLSGQCLNNQDMHIVATQGVSDRQCKILDLSTSEITQDGVSILAYALLNDTCLEELNLSRTIISESGIQWLALTVNLSILKRINLEATDISDKGAKHLAEMLRTNTDLIQLSLSVNQITSRGVNMLVRGVTFILILLN